MILFIANHAFPDHSGFSNRCRNAIDTLGKHHKVAIVCQKHRKEKNVFLYSAGSEKIPIYRYEINHQSIERTNKNSYIAGLYELKRNIDLCFNIVVTLFTVIQKYKSQSGLKAYVVVSPLTTPLFVYAVSLVTPLQLEVVEFHDLEPETAKHLKHLPDGSFVMKIEYWLEKFICSIFKKVVVTNSIQKDRLIERTGINENKVFTLPNILNVNTSKNEKKRASKRFSFSRDDFIITYSSSLSFHYTTAGAISVIKHFSRIQKKIPSCKFVILGGGDGLEVIDKEIRKEKLEEHIITTGKIANVNDYLSITDVAIIPWMKDVMTETILPTKLFEYMAAGKAIVAPRFGEFKRIIEDHKNGLLFSNQEEFIEALVLLFKNPSIKEELGKNAYTYYIDKYNPSRVLDEFNHFLTNHD